MATALAYDEPDATVAEEPAMQVRLLDEDGLMRWHRWLAQSNGMETACGNIVDLRTIQGQRIETYLGEMCPDCFTARELVKAALANTAARRK